MARPIRYVAPGWWDTTTLDSATLEDAAKLTTLGIWLFRAVLDFSWQPGRSWQFDKATL